MGTKTARKIADRFMIRNAGRSGNYQTDGTGFYLFGNKIAEFRNDGLYVTDCGWDTVTTRQALNCLPGVSIFRERKKTFLNGNLWDGSWTIISANVPPLKKGKDIFITQTRYVKIDGWRGYDEPIYAVCGANDTGMESDSPCRTDTCLFELNKAEQILKENKIPFRFLVLPTSNVFCVHRYIITYPSRAEEARKLIEPIIDECRLLYIAGEPVVHKPAPSFNAVAAIAKLGELMTSNPKDELNWKMRMIKAGLPELQLPDDWNSLSDEEKKRRIDGVIEELGK